MLQTFLGGGFTGVTTAVSTGTTALEFPSEPVPDSELELVLDSLVLFAPAFTLKYHLNTFYKFLLLLKWKKPADYTYTGAGFFVGLVSSSLSDSLDELLAGFGAAFTGLLSTFLTFFFGASSSLEESELELSFFTTFLTGAGFFFGAGASSSLDESSLDDSFGFGAAFLAGVATFFATGLAGASSSLESSDDEDSFGFGAFFV